MINPSTTDPFNNASWGVEGEERLLLLCIEDVGMLLGTYST